VPVGRGQRTEAAFDHPQEELGLAFLPALLKPLLCPLLHGHFRQAGHSAVDLLMALAPFERE